MTYSANRAIFSCSWNSFKNMEKRLGKPVLRAACPIRKEATLKRRFVMSFIPRFANALKVNPVSGAGNYIIDVKEPNVYQLKSRYLTNGSIASLSAMAAPKGISRTIINCYQPQPGCAVLVQLHKSSGDNVGEGYELIVFDGRVWVSGRHREDIGVMSDLDVSVFIAPGVVINFRKHKLETSLIHYMLDYWIGAAEIGSLILINQMVVSRSKLSEALTEVRKLKGAVRSGSAAKIEQLLIEVLGI